ncbi:MAG: hypothetical protein NT154_04480 [Verrucomicrobia bacterium]|nr:hypothetical protein [Verrucomicrobiota bacterium]
MSTKLIRSTGVVSVVMALVLLACGESHAQAADIKVQAFLLWGTDDTSPPKGKSYKPVEPDIMQKLKDSPLKWTNWFEVSRKDFAVAQGTAKEVPLSDVCQVNVKSISGHEVEATLIGKGKEVVKRKRSFPKGEVWVLVGGNAPNSTAWLAVLRRIE